MSWAVRLSAFVLYFFFFCVVVCDALRSHVKRGGGGGGLVQLVACDDGRDLSTLPVCLTPATTAGSALGSLTSQPRFGSAARQWGPEGLQIRPKVTSSSLITSSLIINFFAWNLGW